MVAASTTVKTKRISRAVTPRVVTPVGIVIQDQVNPTLQLVVPVGLAWTVRVRARLPMILNTSVMVGVYVRIRPTSAVTTIISVLMILVVMRQVVSTATTL